MAIKSIRHIKYRGYSLIELLVVVAIFSALAIVITQSLATTLKGSKKSENTIRLRENVDYALSILEREIRGAKSITCVGGNPTNRLEYIAQDSSARSFVCQSASGVGAIYSSALGGYLTSTTSGKAINITNCSQMFQCSTPVAAEPPAVDITVKAIEASNAGAEGASLEISTKILTRAY